jgi:hypothetical protein
VILRQIRRLLVVAAFDAFTFAGYTYPQVSVLSFFEIIFFIF